MNKEPSEAEFLNAMQPLLYDARRERRDCFAFKINSGGELCIREDGDVVIIFKNGEFEKVDFRLAGPYSRNGWRILGEIERRISALEREFKEQAQQGERVVFK